MLKPHYPYFLANKPINAQQKLPVTDKYTHEVVAEVSMADASAIERAISAAVDAAPAMASLAAYERHAILQHCISRFQDRADELAYCLCVEAGKPLNDAKGEVGRLIDTFRVAAEESTRMMGEVIPMDIVPRAKHYRGMTKRVPVGPCSFISPFNFPLNLIAHKIAPAIAVGCPFILKPASLTPISALIIGEILAETDLPVGAFSILPCRRDGADLFTTDERLKLLSFTGSPDVGWSLKNKAGKKKVTLELGGNAACIVDQDTDIDDAVARLIVGAFYQSGQSCISVQRILVHSSLYDELKHKLVTAAQGLVVGDPKEMNTFVGPMITEKEAQRVEKWIVSAVANGATILCGGHRDGAIVAATLLENVDPSEAVYAEEVFGPVALLESFNDFSDALDKVNNSRFGLQAGVFTRDLYKAQKAWDTLDVGAVVIGDVPSWRVDHMPYGGVKDSGIGREGVRYAMEDMTETRLMVVRDLCRD